MVHQNPAGIVVRSLLPVVVLAVLAVLVPTAAADGDPGSTASALAPGPDQHLRISTPEETVDLQAPSPVALQRTAGGENVSQMLVPDDVADRVDPRVLDVADLARRGLVEDGTVPVLVQTTGVLDLPRDLLGEPQPFAHLEIVAGRVALADLAPLARLPAVEGVFLDDPVEVNLADSVPLVQADEVHDERDDQGRSVTGHGVDVAVIDTGVDYTHSDLGGCLGNGCKVEGGYDFVHDDTDPMDDNGHGTHVAATAAGEQGVAPNATILAYKVCNEWGSCQRSDILAAIENATLDGADVISISLGGPGTTDSPMAEAADWAVEQGVVVVSAAGNSGPSDETVGVPAASLEGIAVGATDKSDRVASFSSRGPVRNGSGAIAAIKPDVAAPGVDIHAAVPTGDCRLCDPSGYRTLSGTSMATPHVSGTAALLIQDHPDWAPDSVKGALMGQAVDVGEDTRSQGTGRIDAYASHEAELAILPGNDFVGVDASSQPRFDANTTYTVRNLGNATVNLSLAATSPNVTTTVEPGELTLGPGEQTDANVTVEANNSDLPDGWYEGGLEADGDARSKARYTLVKSGVIHLGFDDVWTVLVLKNGSWHDTLLRPPESLDYLAPDGNYEFRATYPGCPGSVTDCGHSFTFAFAEDVVHESESTVNLTRPEDAHEIQLDAHLEDGSRVPPDTTWPCQGRPDDPVCFDRWALFLTRNGSDTLNYLTSGGSNDPMYLETVSEEWSFGRSLTYRDALEYYAVGNATRGTQDDVVWEVAPDGFEEYGVRYRPMSGYDHHARLMWCGHDAGGAFYMTADRMTVTDGLRETIYAGFADLAPLSLQGANDVNPVPCEYMSQEITEGVDAGGDCVEAPCRTYAESLQQDPTGDGPVQFEMFFRDRVLDDRYALADGDIVVADGAPGFRGEVNAWNDRVLFFARYPAYWSYFTPGSGGHQFAFQGDGEGLNYELRFDGSVVASGTPDRFNDIDLPDDGSVDLNVSLDGAVLETRQGRAEHHWSYHTDDRFGDLPRIRWARVHEDGDIGTAFGTGSDLELAFKIEDPQDANLTDVKVQVDTATGYSLLLLPQGPHDGVYRAALPNVGENLYDVTIRARTEDGIELSLEQAPAYVVGDPDPVNAVAKATPDPANLGQNVTFDGTDSWGIDESISSYTWSIGDETVAETPTFDASFETAGQHCADLVVESENGTTDNATACVDVDRILEAEATVAPETVNLGQNVTFDGFESWATHFPIESYTWTFGDEIVAQRPVFDASFETAGRHCADLVVESESGATDDATACVDVTDELAVTAVTDRQVYGPTDEATVHVDAAYVDERRAEGADVTVQVNYTTGDPVLDALLAPTGCSSWTANATTDDNGTVAVTVPRVVERCSGLGVPFDLVTTQDGAYEVDAEARLHGNAGEDETAYRVEAT